MFAAFFFSFFFYSLSTLVRRNNNENNKELCLVDIVLVFFFWIVSIFLLFLFVRIVTMPAQDLLGPDGGNTLLRKARVTYKRYLDASVPHRGLRWCFFAFLAILYVARVVIFGGFYVITYGLCIHLLYLLLLLITPLSEPDDEEGTTLPTTQSEGDEYRPFMPKVQEFVVWKKMFAVLAVCLFLTMFPFLDIPVFWPILVLYFVILFVTQMGGRVKHMIKHGYVPWNTGKPKFVPKSTS